MSRLVSALIVSLVLGVAGSVHAAPLTTLQLDALDQYLAREGACLLLPAHARPACRASMFQELGISGADAAWEKDGLAGITPQDQLRALAEYWDEGTLAYICYGDAPANSVVRFVESCGRDQCVEHLRAACQTGCSAPPCACAPESFADECADADGDGLFAYQEQELGLRDDHHDTCSSHADCGFQGECKYLEGERAFHVRPICQERACAGGTCTAFHLELVSEDADELIVQVHFDYAPEPLSVLDLYVEFDPAVLKLAEARPLATLRSAQHELKARQVAEGRLRLVVFGTNDKRPIEQGAIAELVFERRTGAQARVAFSSSSQRRQGSMALRPGSTGRAELTSDALWGDAVQVSAAAAEAPRLVLHYGFDDGLHPLALRRVRSGLDLCPANPNQRCTAQLEGKAPPVDEPSRTRLAQRIDALQRGAVEVSGGSEGVSGAAALLDGYADHLELPLTFHPAGKEQDFSLSAWFFSEPDPQRAGVREPQVLFSHNNANERTQYAVTLVSNETGTFDVVFSEGDLAQPSARRVLFAGLAPGMWRHFALSVDARPKSSGGPQALFYLDGQASEPVALAAPPSCPAFVDERVSLHELGDVTGGRVPESLFLAAAQSNLYGIERMDLNGLDRETLVRTPDGSARHPHYSPVVDKIVYASSTGGSYEIWIANADGTDPQQVTRGFGDASRGIRAGHPRWAPDGSAIVFESNVYDLPADDNAFARGSHLYYVQYDALNGRVNVPMPGGAPASQLDYRQLLSLQIVDDYRLTHRPQHHREARWLRGPFTESGTSYLGELVLNTVSKNGKDSGIASLRIRNPIRGTEAEPLAPFGKQSEGELSAELSVLAAGVRRERRDDPGVSQLLLQKQWVSLAAHPDVTLAVVDEGSTVKARLTYVPEGLAASCWDLDRDHQCDLGSTAEDRDGNGTCNVRDCAASELNDLYVAYDGAQLRPRLSEDDSVSATRGPNVPPTKQLRATALYGDKEYVKLEVLAPLDALPLPSGGVLAELTFDKLSGFSAPGGLAAERRSVRQALFVARDGHEPEPFASDGLHQVLAAAFSPDGLHVALAAVQGSRPLVVTQSLATGSAGRRTISERPVRVDGLDWVKREQLYACNWLGALRDRTTGSYGAGLRGGLDELKVYDYVRTQAAFVSEAERGHERLAQRGGDGAVSGSSGTCEGDLDCPSYQLCDASTHSCRAVSCDPEEPYACARGKCTLKPVPVAGTGLDWVCSVECEVDAQCFTQECLNGPCRFCNATTHSCEECRTAMEDLGGVAVTGIEGCPDRNSFACEEGSCLTECYSFANEQSTYLCRPGLEYCRQGTCTTFDWSWSDLSPVTLAGAGEMMNDLPNLKRTRAISQLHEVTLEAFGSEDYGASPELVVEGRVTTPGADPYAGAWFSLGRIQVHHRLPQDAAQAPYRLQTPHPITELRVRMSSDSYDVRYGSVRPALPSVPGSGPFLGYRADIGFLAVSADCAGKPGCKPVGSDARLRYMVSGQPTVVITALRVRGQSLLGLETAHNYACPYDARDEGTTLSPEPVGPHGRARPAVLTALADHACLGTGCAAKRDWALLNCSHTDEAGRVAELVVRVPPGSYPDQNSGLLRVGAITETSTSCFVEVDATRTELCYEWIGHGASLDSFSAPRESNRTLDYDTFRGFGYDAEPEVTP